MDEVEQIVFIQVLQKIDQLKDPEAFHGWVKMIAHRMAINFKIRGRGKQDINMSAMGSDESRPWQPEDNPEDRPLQRVLDGEQERRLIASLEQMKPTDRLRLRQFYLQNMSLQNIIDEAGGATKLPVGTVKRQLHTARKRLLDLMGHEMAN